MTDSSLLVVGSHRIEQVWSGPPSAGPALVFLHEGLGSVSLWKDFPARVASATGLSAFVYSRLGYGASDPVALPRPLTYMHEEARLLPSILDAAGIVDAILVGHSDGASISIIATGSGALPRARALILLAPHVFVEDISVESIEKARDAYDHDDLRERLTRHHGANVDVAFRGWNGAWLDPGFRSWNIESYLSEIRCPVLVIQGARDEYGTWAQVDAIERQIKGPVEVAKMHESGHSPHRDEPEATLEAIASFVLNVVR